MNTLLERTHDIVVAGEVTRRPNTLRSYFRLPASSPAKSPSTIRAATVAVFLAVALPLPAAEKSATDLPAPAQTPIVFARDIQPLLERSCLPCHSGEKAKAKFHMDRRDTLLSGGESKEDAVLPGKSAASPVIRFAADLVEEMEMPPLEKRDRYPALSASEIAQVRAWIDQGANWPAGIVLSARPDAAPENSRAAADKVLPESAHPIFTLIRVGDQAAIAAWLKDAPDLSLRDASGNTPLIQAAFYLDAPQVAGFLDRGADVNATDTAGMTALMKAVSDVEKVRLLIKRGAKVNAATQGGNTALITACFEFGSAAVVSELVKHGAEVNAVSKPGNDALKAAAGAGDVDGVRILLDHGADPNSRATLQSSSGGITPLMSAAIFGHLDVVRLLLARGADMNLETANGNAVNFATFTQRQDVVRLLLDHRAKVNVSGKRVLSARPDTGLTPLMFAAYSERNDPTIVQWLLERGADVNARASSGETALSIARQRGRTKIVSALEAAGAPADAAEVAPEQLTARWKPEQIRDANATVIRQAAEAGAAVLVKSGARLTEATSNRCFTCHQQGLPAVVGAMAVAKGLDYPTQVAQAQLLATLKTSQRARDLSLEQPAPVANIPSWLLIGLGAERFPSGPFTDHFAYSLARSQYGDGRWISRASRAPTDVGDVTSTALAMRALALYAPPTMKPRMDARIAAAARWLSGFAADTTDDRAMQILGLHWAGRPKSELDTFARNLRAMQRADGGWAQLTTLESDAYATGLVLYALHQAGGIVPADAAYQRAAKYLLASQLADGTWRVKTRASPVQVAIDDIFPHGPHQWISSVATGWSSMALMLALPDQARQVSERSTESTTARIVAAQ
jgi:ankyrin repeat protein